MTHRWSGWPGAVCLDCGVEDQTEYCVAVCPNAFTRCSCDMGCDTCCGTGAIPNDCPEHVNGECTAKIDE